MPESEKIELDPEATAFFNTVVPKAFETLKDQYLDGSALCKTRLNSDSAELFIFFDPSNDKKGFHYILRYLEGILWRRSYYTNRMGETPDIDNDLITENCSDVTTEQIIFDFTTQYRDDLATKPLRERPDMQIRGIGRAAGSVDPPDR